jgi:DNA polymerase III delta prime subunit
MAPSTAVNIHGSIPLHWRDCVGNKELVDIYQDLLRQVRLQQMPKRFNLFVHGDSRSGKTATTKLFAKAMLCRQLDPTTLDPCGKCRNCTSPVEDYGYRGLELWEEDERVHYVPIDATKIDATELMILLNELTGYAGTRIIFIDEVHRLAHKSRRLEELLLKPVEEKPFIWIVASAQVGDLEPMFYNRFVLVKTTLPTIDELVLWLQDRCDEWGIRYEDPALIELARRANLSPGMSLNVLQRALLKPAEGLTMGLVKRHQFNMAP